LTLVSTGWLAEHLFDPELVVVDMRWREDGSGPSCYQDGHIPGAVFLDWSTDIVDPAHSVAFMLAPPERFAMAMERVGIGDVTTVVAYSDLGGSGPFRLWWACRRYGHDQVRILDGGFAAWKAEGRPTTRDVPTPRTASWTPRPAVARVATADDVDRAKEATSAVVLDSRPLQQFEGAAVWFETGPVPADRDGIAHTPRGDLRAGRVPWARSVPWSELYRPDLTMKSPEELRAMFEEAGVEPDSTCITYCGVGVSAAALLFALHHAGIEDAALYDASWEEWGRDPGRPIARG